MAVVEPGDTANVCDTLGPTDDEHGLYLVDTSAGHTAAVTIDGVTGRTMTASDNPSNTSNMYLSVDDRIAHDGQFTAAFTIVYYHQGTDAWTLQYDGTGNAYTTAGRITKTDTNTWKTATFTITDAHLANSENGSTDFRIRAAGPGYADTIHSVGIQCTGPGALAMNFCASSD